MKVLVSFPLTLRQCMPAVFDIWKLPLRVKVAPKADRVCKYGLQERTVWAVEHGGASKPYLLMMAL